MYRDPSAVPSAFQGGLSATFVPMHESEAMRVALEHFGLDGQAMRFATEKDDTFRISAADGARFILKVANPEEELSEIDLQLRILEHVAAVAPDLPVPRVRASTRGELQFSYRDAAGQQRQVRMMSYLEGRPLSEVPSTPSGRREIGRLLARLRLALTDFSHPADSRVLAWDVKHLLTLQGLVAGIDDPRQRDQVEKGLARFASIAPQLAGLRSQVLHNDFSTSNIVVDPATPKFVTGIIDFGDAVRTHIAIDVSTALVNQLPRDVVDQEFFADGRDLLHGYLAVADLSDDELTILPHLVMGRVLARVLLSISLAHANPGNATYLLRNTAQSWRQLDWFLARSEAGVSEQFLRSVA